MRPLSFFLNRPSQILLSLLNKLGGWLPDKHFLKLKFRLEMGYQLDLNNPRTFQEKIQWLKLYNRKPEYTMMVDKCAVKEYVGKKIGEQYIIPTIGVWDSFDDIDFDKLPERFVLKTTHGGGNCGVVICNDKSKLDIVKAKHKLNKSLNSDIYKFYREWPYKHVTKRIIAEQFIGLGISDLIDYKFYCFDGEPLYCQVIADRNTNETIDFYDQEWNHQPFNGLNRVGMAAVPQAPPQALDKMLAIARILSRGHTFLRVDLYNIDGKIYFGEITFYPASGIGTFTPNEWNLKLGELIKLKN